MTNMEAVDFSMIFRF